MTEPHGLARVVSRWEVVALAVNDVVGSGVYVILPVAAAALLGPASIFAIFAAGLAVLLLVLCFAEASSHFDETGGAYVYTKTAFGALVGFEVGWLTWVARVASVASLASYFARAVAGAYAPAGAGATPKSIEVGIVVALTLVNVRGVKSGARAAVVLSCGKLLPLLLFVVVGLFHVNASRLAPAMPTMGKLGEAALLVLYAYSGFENAPGLAGELRDPRRDLPFALIAMTVAVTALYTLVQIVALGAIPDLAATPNPLAAAAHGWLGPAGGAALAIGAGLSILGSLNNTVLSGPRYLYAITRDRMPDSIFARLHPRFRTPHIAIGVQAVLACGLLLTGTAEQLAELSVVARLATYAGTALAVPILRRTVPRGPRTIRLPGGPAIPVAALAICLVFLASATRKNLVAGAIALVVGAALFFLRPRRG